MTWKTISALVCIGILYYLHQVSFHYYPAKPAPATHEDTDPAWSNQTIGFETRRALAWIAGKPIQFPRGPKLSSPGYLNIGVTALKTPYSRDALYNVSVRLVDKAGNATDERSRIVPINKKWKEIIFVFDSARIKKGL